MGKKKIISKHDHKETNFRIYVRDCNMDTMFTVRTGIKSLDEGKKILEKYETQRRIRGMPYITMFDPLGMKVPPNACDMFLSNNNTGEVWKIYGDDSSFTPIRINKGKTEIKKSIKK